jgi:hypothetical protein
MNKGPDLPVFIRQHFRSVWALEILLLLHRNRSRSWTIDEIVRELRATAPLVASNLEQLQRNGLCVAGSEGRVRFQPASPVLEQLCNQAADAYRERPVSIINLISAPEDRLQQLADAFRFKGRRT